MTTYHSQRMNRLQKELEAEFCPPLDTSLLAALLAETSPEPTNDEISDLRKTLHELACQADFDLATDTSASSSSSSDSPFNSTPSELESCNTSASDLSVSSPLGFLSAALPHVPISTLRAALDDIGADNADTLDMEAAIESILTRQYIDELEERGLDEVENNDGEDTAWTMVSHRRLQEPKSPVVPKPEPKQKPKQQKALKVSLVDVRQQNHRRPVAAAPADLWSQISSLTAHLASALHPTPATYFSSFFHNPQYPTPAQALRAALKSMPDDPKALKSDPSQLVDLVPPGTSMDDIILVCKASRGRADDALDVLSVLSDLERTPDMAVLHSPLPSTPTTFLTSPIIPQSPALPSTHATAPASPIAISPATTVHGTKARNKELNTSSWHEVPVREIRTANPHAAFIPSLASPKSPSENSVKRKPRPAPTFNRVLPQAEEQTQESLLREAARAWMTNRRNGMAGRGGEVAMVYAERAREIGEIARRNDLEDARARVEKTLATSRDGRTIDLHGTTTTEAVSIVQGILARTGAPLTIITGRGKHSAGRVGVLGPAVQRALAEDGWSVSKWEGSLTVRGRLSSGR